MNTMIASPQAERQCHYQSALIIDDDPLFQIVTSEALQAAGLKNIELANDGVQGLEVLSNAPETPDLLVIDLQMPNMTGVDVVRELSRLSYKGTVIIISSEDEGLVRSVYSMARMLGVNIIGALRKPLNVEQFHGLIRQKADINAAVAETIISREQAKQAIEECLIIPFFQPKISLRDNSVSGFEVLARFWDDPVISSAPIDYLNAIEKYGLSIDLVCMMIAKAGHQTRHWQDTAGPLKLAFNLTPLAVQDSSLPDRLLSAVKAAGLAPQSVILEITENHLLENTAASLEVLSLIRLYGFGLSIDDFGTGATSIEQLRTFPFTELKIDGRFMMASHDDAFSRITVQTSAKLAAMLGMTVVAEGVETADAIHFALLSGAHEVQGFHFSRPLPAAEATQWIKANAAKQSKVA